MNHAPSAYVSIAARLVPRVAGANGAFPASAYARNLGGNINPLLFQATLSIIMNASVSSSSFGAVAEFKPEAQSAHDTADIESQKSRRFLEADAGDGTKRDDQFLEGLPLVLCLIGLFFCLFLLALDSTIVVTLLTTVGNKFDSMDKIAWLTAGFLLSTSVFTALWGKFSIIFGRKYSMLVAIVLFEAGSLMCALAQNMNVLIGGRVFAGVGGGGIQSLCFIIVSEAIPIHKRPLAMGLMASCFAVASVLGPIIGGSFTTHVSWRWCFYINLPIGAIAFVFILFTFNPPRPSGDFRAKLKRIDYVGAVLLTAGVVVFLLGMTFGNDTHLGWDSAHLIACFVVGGVTFIAFCYWNVFHSGEPLLPWEIVRVPQIAASAISIFCYYGFFMGNILYTTIYFQVIHGADALRSGIDTLPMVISVVISSILGGALVNKTRYVKPYALIAGVIGPVGCGVLTLLKVKSNIHQKIGLLILPGISIGIMMQSTITSAQISSPKTPGSMILTTTLVSFARSLGGAVMSNVADATYGLSLRHRLASTIKKAPRSIQEEIGSNITKFTENTSALASLSSDAQNLVKEAVMWSIRNVFYVSLGLAILGAISGALTTNKRLPTGGRQGNVDPELGEKLDDKPDKDSAFGESETKAQNN